MLIFPFFVSCSNDLLGTASDDLNKELPITFDILWPETSGMRGFDEDTDIKKYFKNGDVIHLLGTFNIEILQEDGITKIPKVVKRYGALTYNERTNNWNEVTGNNLTWPSTAINGTFQAYYISGSNGVLTNEDPSKTYELSSITPATDPLQATTEEPVLYGRAVQLNFSHICAYLTLVDLEPMVAEQYWFYTDHPKDPETFEETEFNNAFKIVLGTSNETETLGQPTLNFEFCKQPNPQFEDLVYISANAIETTSPDINSNEKVITKANYFLEPGYYETFSLCYPAIAPKVYNYLKYDYKNIPENVGGTEVKNIPPNLEAGTTYTLTITKSPGVTIVNPPSAEGWDDEGEYHEVDVEEFLKAVWEKKEYENKEGTKILEQTANGTRLLHNIDFGNFNYSDFNDKSFRPNTQQGSVFDGNYHYIKNLASPLFRYNYGTIQNVGIKDIKIESDSYEEDNENDDMSRHGALCMWNRNDASINNVRVTDVNMTISVQSGVEASKDGSETHNIGCLIGSNTGKVSEVALAGNFVLHVEGNSVNASVLVGGLIGQNAAQGAVYDVSPLENNLNTKIYNECSGTIGSYSIGGIVGESTGFITGVILSDVTIDSSRSSGVTSYIGGIAGQLAVSENLTSTASLNSCIVSGSVTAGTTTPYQDLTSGSYIGGIAGADIDVPVVDCRTAVSVIGSTTPNAGAIYATGGAFGRIRESKNYTFENLIAYGSLLNGPNTSGAKQYIGNFAGIVPQGQDWSNYADKNIIVRKFGNYENIGAALDNNNND